jgi:hypothetical protein
MKNDDFVAPMCILMIAVACHIICNNQRGRYDRYEVRLKTELRTFPILSVKTEEINPSWKRSIRLYYKYTDVHV